MNNRKQRTKCIVYGGGAFRTILALLFISSLLFKFHAHTHTHISSFTHNTIALTKACQNEQRREQQNNGKKRSRKVGSFKMWTNYQFYGKRTDLILLNHFLNAITPLAEQETKLQTLFWLRIKLKDLCRLWESEILCFSVNYIWFVGENRTIV